MAALSRLGRALTPITPGAKRAVVVLFLLTVALAGVNLLWTSHAVDANNRKWCALMITIDRANAAAPKRPAPGTFTAEFTGEITQLSRSLGC